MACASEIDQIWRIECLATYIPICTEPRGWMTVCWEEYREQLFICGEAVGSWGWVGGVVIGTAGLITVAVFVRAGPPGWTAPREPFAVGDPPAIFLGWPAPAGTLERKKERKLDVNVVNRHTMWPGHTFQRGLPAFSPVESESWDYKLLCVCVRCTIAPYANIYSI